MYKLVKIVSPSFNADRQKKQHWKVCMNASIKMGCRFWHNVYAYQVCQVFEDNKYIQWEDQYHSMRTRFPVSSQM